MTQLLCYRRHCIAIIAFWWPETALEAKQIFHRIWITGRKSLQVVKWALCLCLAWPFVTKLLAKSSHAWYWNFPAFKDVWNLVSKIVIQHLDQNDRCCCVYYCTFMNWGPGEFHQPWLVIRTFHRQGRCSRGGHLCNEHNEEKYSCIYK